MQEENTHQKDELIKSQDQVVQSNSTLSIDYVKEYLLTAEFDFNPTQDKISFPLIQLYIQMLKDGNNAPDIFVDNNSIVNGHHRYISGCIYEKRPGSVPWPKAPSTAILSWENVIVAEEDFGPNYDDKSFNRN